jgi:hypothetical protein
LSTPAPKPKEERLVTWDELKDLLGELLGKVERREHDCRLARLVEEDRRGRVDFWRVVEAEEGYVLEPSYTCRLFCYGCDEGRRGRVLHPLRYVGLKAYREVVCEGCFEVLAAIRPLLPPFAQVDSHEGVVVWRIPRDPFERSGFLRKFRENVPKVYSASGELTTEDDENTITVAFTDDGSAEQLLEYLAAKWWERRKTVYVEDMTPGEGLS